MRLYTMAKNEKVENKPVNNAEMSVKTLTENEKTLQLYGLKVDASKPLQLYSAGKQASRELTLTDKESQLSASVLQKAVTVGKALDYVVISELAKLKRASAHKDTGYDNFGQFGEALTGWSKTTVNSYANAGDTFTDMNGAPLRPFVSRVPVAVLNQLVGIINNPVYVYKVRIDLDTLEATLNHFKYALSVAKVNELLRIFRGGDIPTELVRTEVVAQADGSNATKYYFVGTDKELAGYVPPTEKEPAPAPAPVSQKGKKDENTDENKDKEKTPSEMVSDGMALIGKMELSDSMKERYDSLLPEILEFLADLPTEGQKETEKK